MTTSAAPAAGVRKPVAIDDGLMRAGTQTAAFDSAQPETLFRNYLRLIRRARSQQRAPEISLRREDIEAISEYLGVTAEHVLNRLATLMGSSRTQRTTMLAAFASGALLVGLAGSASATSPDADRFETAAPAATPTVVPETDDNPSTEEPRTAPQPAGTPTAAPDTSSTEGSSADATQRPPTMVTGDVGADQPPVTLVGEVVSAPPVTSSGNPSASTGSGASSGAGSGSGVTDVSLVAPVIPSTADTVAVGDAVVPTTTSIPAADDSSDPASSQDEPDVGVGAAQPVDDGIPQELPPVDDDTVAVGSPPVPPTTPPATTTTTVSPTTTTPTTTTAPAPSTTTPTTTSPTTTSPTTTIVPTSTTVPSGTTVPVDPTP